MGDLHDPELQYLLNSHKRERIVLNIKTERPDRDFTLTFLIIQNQQERKKDISCREARSVMLIEIAGGFINGQFFHTG
ncbi:MAG: hypothetical protein STSR0009_05300 [Methanoregula sp.]